MNLADRVTELQLDPAEIERRTGGIRREVLGSSRLIAAGNFGRVGKQDLRLLFDLYDARFFAGALRTEIGTRPGVRFSGRMTSAAGKTYYRIPARGRRGGDGTRGSFEIVISSHLLLSNFNGDGRPVRINGTTCRDRLDALQRVFEHELVHLVELLTRGESSCRATPFRDLARRLFNHADVTHELVTPRERARLERDLRVGDRVRFSFDGTVFAGRINRITKRATVLVPDESGERYSDGVCYLKFYVPLGRLQKR